MEKDSIKKSNVSRVAYRVLLAVFLAIIGILAAGSLSTVFISPDSKPLFRFGTNKSLRDNRKSAPKDAEVSIFSGIGRLRIPVQPASTVVVSISFPYPAWDGPFAEELASNIGNFKSAAAGYFSSLPADKIINMNEESAKAEILKRYNALLRLGKIETLYFSDLMVMD